jgi:cytochrome c-type biogenesis protein CcmH
MTPPAWCLAAVLALGAAPAVAAVPSAVPGPAPASVEGAADSLAERLVAPCCWRESLRSHPSPLADALRLELRTRLAAGESAAHIEQDLVVRYGPRIRAFSPDWDPRKTAGILLFVVATASLVMVVAWTRRQRAHAALVVTPAAAPADPRLEELLDDELARADG